jgi:hypothetical protein
MEGPCRLGTGTLVANPCCCTQAIAACCACVYVWQ